MIIVRILFLLLFPNAAYAAIAATSVWEARSTATAADVNGCFFDSSKAGTDFSLQNPAQYGFADLASTNGTTNPCVVSSASHNFVTADEGNGIHILSGTNWTAGWYEIVSTSANKATLDRACATAASVNTGTYNVGGACSMSSSLDTTLSTTFQAGNTLWVKNGSYSQTASLTFTNCTNAATCLISGYGTSRGDNPTGTNRPDFNLNATQLNPGAHTRISNFRFSGTAATMTTSNGQCVWTNNKFLNSSNTTGRLATSMGSADLLINNEITSANGIAVNTAGTLTVLGNFIHDSSTGIRSTATGSAMTVVNNILAGNYVNGINISGANTDIVTIYNNTVYGTEGKIGTGLLIAATAGVVRAFNNIFYGLATGVSLGASTDQYGDYNEFFNNTTNRTNWSTGSNDVALNPGFAATTQVTGTAGVISSATLTDSSANFSNVVDNRDYVMVISGTGITNAPGAQLITSHTTTSVTGANAFGGSGTNISYVVRTGNNFAVSPTMKFKGFPGLFPAGFTQGWIDLGGAQRHEYGRPAGGR